uniref:NACHT LRR and PYD domain-containing protein n=1 Tax=Hucho hucho TaxID=62062 RepID=A0A4W5QUF9_9TELE
MQEFLTALYVFLMFNNNVNRMAEQETMPNDPLTSNEFSATILHQSAVDKALKSENGHLDLFLSFLLSLSLESNQTLLRGLPTQTRSSSQSHKETVEYVKENPSPEKCISLFHCLNELNDHSLVEEIQRHLGSGNLSTAKRSPAESSALVFVLLTSEEMLDIFDLRKFSGSEEGLLPVVKASRVVLLMGCNVTEKCCEALASSLSSSQLRTLNLDNNDL